jgi:formate dehydrogenase subunit beta
MENKVREFIDNCFEKGDISGVVVMAKQEDGYYYSFFDKSSNLEEIKPFHPVMKMNGGKIVSLITKENPNNNKFLFILKPCEVRAAIELKKLNQIDIESCIFVSYTCPGVLNFKEGNNYSETESLIENFKNGNIDEDVRELCKTCTQFSGEGADILIDLFKGKFVSLNAKGEEFLSKISFDFDKEFDESDTIKNLRQLKENNLNELVKKQKEFFTDEEKIIEYFDKCIGCHACNHVCPICYCRHCYFESDTFKYYPDSIRTKLDTRKAIRLPMDRIMFHLGRVTHMAASCVGCGMCEDVCPVNIKVGQFFKYTGSQIQNVFQYEPGVNREDVLPLLTFKQEELREFED